MIVIHGTLSLDPANDAEFLAALEPLVRLTNQEDGCTAYVFTRDLDRPGVFHIFEEWASGEALTAHMAADHFKAFGRAIRGLGITGSSIDRYEAISKGPLA